MSQIRMRGLSRGIVTHVPVLGGCACRCAVGTLSARHCCGVWVRDLVRAAEAGRDASPRTVAALGPGDSFGGAMYLAALTCATIAGRFGSLKEEDRRTAGVLVQALASR